MIAIASGEKIRRGERIGKALLLYQAWTITVISIFCSQVQPLREETSSCAISLYTAIDCAYSTSFAQVSIAVVTESSLVAFLAQDTSRW